MGDFSVERQLDPLQSPELTSLSTQISEHPLYARMTSMAAVKTFVEHHIWCVWDFMCLAKSIQAAVTSPPSYWTPSEQPELLWLINDILRTEETDRNGRGTRLSHFEVFHEAMVEADADTGPIDAFIRQLQGSVPVSEAMARAGAPDSSRQFVRTTLSHASGPLHVRAASFCIGREQLVPQMLESLTVYLPKHEPKLSKLRWYIERHIHLDTHQHGNASRQILQIATGGVSDRLQEAIDTGVAALRARLNYLDEILKMV